MFPALEISLPITDPTWIFFLVLMIILITPLVLEKLRIPHIIGMILAGVLIGEYGFNILERDSSFELFGKVGLYYIMFLAGLEMDMEDFKKNKSKGIVFGLLTFILPMALGIWSGMQILGFSLVTSTLLSSMYASHTLVTYPIISRYGLSRQRSVNITIGGTVVTVTLALIILAVISGMYKGNTGGIYWAIMGAKVTVLTIGILFLFPLIARHFFRNHSDNILQFVFVLGMVFLGGGLMEMVGMEGILGAFLAGLVLNRLIPRVSPLMNRLEFVGNALFIPYFLIGVGMIIDVKSMLAWGTALKVAIVMTAVATLSKWLAAFFTQKIFHMEKNERSMIFGLSNAQAAATLAAVLVGHEIILENGERLLNDDVLNGTIVMILLTCIISSFVTERAARKFALEEKLQFNRKDDSGKRQMPEQILIPIANPDTIENLMGLALIIKESRRKTPLMALNIITDNNDMANAKQNGEKNLDKAAMIAAAADVKMNAVTRFDINVATGIIHAVKEYNATSLILGMHDKANIIDSFFGSLTTGILKSVPVEMLIARLRIPISTVRKIHVSVPPRAEYETGFADWVKHLSRMASQIGCHIHFYSNATTAGYLAQLLKKGPASTLAVYEKDIEWNDFDSIRKKSHSDHLFIIVSARRGSISYEPASIERLPSQLARAFTHRNLIVLYPEQFGKDEGYISFSDPMSNNEYQHYEQAREWLTGIIKPQE